MKLNPNTLLILEVHQYTLLIITQRVENGILLVSHKESVVCLRVEGHEEATMIQITLKYIP